jgi:putative membrane protein
MESASPPQPALEEWQRLAPLSLLFLIVSGSLKFVRENLFMFAGAGAGFAFLDRLGLREFFLIGGGGLLIAVLVALINYRRFRFRVEEDALRVRRGLLETKDLRVRFARVQNVALNQPIYFRPFGLVRFQVETPGAESAEVELPGIREDVALALRDRIAGYGGADTLVDERVDEDGEVAPASTANMDAGGIIHAPTSRRLFMHGLVSNQVWVIAGVIAWLFGSLEERVTDLVAALGIERVLEQFSGTGWLGLLVLGLGLIPLLFLLSGTIAWLRYQGFELRRHGDRIVSVAGLAERREQSIRTQKLTGLSLYETALGRLLGQRYLVVRQAKSGGEEADGSRASFLIPGLSGDDQHLVGAIMQGAELPQRFRSVSRRFVYLYATRIAVLLWAAYGLAWLKAPQVSQALPLVFVGLLIVLGLVYLRWRCWGWRIDGELCWVQQGLLGRRRDVFAIPLVQQVRVVQTPYLRRHGLATVRLTLPQGDHDIPMLPIAQAADLANRAVLAAETALVHRV